MSFGLGDTEHGNILGPWTEWDSLPSSCILGIINPKESQ